MLCWKRFLQHPNHKTKLNNHEKAMWNLYKKLSLVIQVGEEGDMRQAEITDKDAYKRVADTLIRMKTFADGKEIVKKLVSKYRQEYKRRPYMMKELDRV